MNPQLLDYYSDYLISQNQLATATGLSALLDGEVSHDQITRFLHAGEFGSKQLWQYVKPTVKRLSQTSDDGVLILDDTIEEKAYTDENEVVCWHYSHAKGRHVKGMNLLSCLVRYGDVALPIGYEVVKKDQRYFDEATQRAKRQASVSKNEHFRALVSQAMNNGVAFDYVLADNWFGAKANMHFIHDELGKKFIFGIKSNRCVALTQTQQSRGQFQSVKSLDWQDGDCKVVYLKDISMPVKLLKKVFKNGNGSTGTLYLVSNDLTLEADRFYAVYQKRWRIEEFHKSMKQNVSLAKSPTKVMKSQLNHIFASFIGFCKLELLKVKTSMNHFAMKYKLILKANQAALKELRNLQAYA